MVFVSFYDSINWNQSPKHLKQELGNKGYHLCDMSRIAGINIPEAIIIHSSICNAIKTDQSIVDKIIDNELLKKVEDIASSYNSSFIRNNAEELTLFSIRSGSMISMPGMMDTILNIGMNTKKFDNLYAKRPTFAVDIYIRFLKYFMDVILNVRAEDLYAIFHKKIEDITKYDIYDLLHDLKKNGYDIPQDPREQIKAAILAVINSWNSERAKYYRKSNGISDDIGTAIVIQRMVFGNLNQDSYTGVLFTCNPMTGEDDIICEYMQQAQGEDIVSGKKDPKALEKDFKYFNQIYTLAKQLDAYYKYAQDIEFTIESGKLYVLQTRNVKLSPSAEINMLYRMKVSGKITAMQIIQKLNAESIKSLFYTNMQITDDQEIIGVGLPASAGCVSGIIALSSEQVLAYKNQDANQKVILVRNETLPDDIKGISAADGVLTAHGGLTSHAAVITRSMGRTAVVGASSLSINYTSMSLECNNMKLQEGEYITIDGQSGNIYNGKSQDSNVKFNDKLYEVLGWIKNICNPNIFANADTAQEIEKMQSFHGNGIGLCRTEHMFMASERISAIRMILLNAMQTGVVGESNIKKAEDLLFEYQKADFLSMYKIIKNQTMKIRLLDAPLHEFIPSESEANELAKKWNIDRSMLNRALSLMNEKNPMLGFRGCRMGISNPTIYQIQVHAILSAAFEASHGMDKKIVPYIMLPLVATPNEAIFAKKIITEIIDDINLNYKYNLDYKIGLMLEIPSILINIQKVIEHFDFFSVGTNDLTQMTMGISRDDTAGFLQQYANCDIIESDPFKTIDDSVIALLKLAMPYLKNKDVCICGEHGGDIASIKKLLDIGINNFSCSVFRMPSAALYLAQRFLYNR